MREFFLDLWYQREHVSFISGADLGGEPLAHMFSHVLPRSTYSEAHKDPDNVVFMTLEEHMTWEFNAHRVANDPLWAPMFELEKKLKEKYSKKNFINNA